MSRKDASANNIRNFVYWIGVVAALSCIALAFAGNSDFVSRLNSSNLPVAWIAGGLSILAFLVDELVDRGAAQRAVSPQEVFQEEEVLA